MRHVVGLLVGMVLLVMLSLVPLHADASPQGCISSNYRAKGCVRPAPAPNLVPVSVPEPSTLLLLGTGLVGLVGLRRRKQ